MKNQDPDCTRTLYTYLFTKPSTSKRFESLVDSAAAGKGLDEVMHLFESPMPHGTNLVTEAADSCHELDEYETPGDASAEDAAENAEADEKYDDYDGVGNIMTQDEKAGGENEGDVVEYGLEVDENQDQGDSHPTDAELSAEAMVQPSASSAAHGKPANFIFPGHDAWRSCHSSGSRHRRRISDFSIDLFFRR